MAGANGNGAADLPDVDSDAQRGRQQASAPLWEILICSVNARTAELTALLAHLEAQLASHDGAVRVLIDRDDCVRTLGEKRTRLLQRSCAQYVSFLDDDDEVDPSYVDAIVAALASRPDYVGFRVDYTHDGVPQKPATHSLRYTRWSDDEHGYYRGIVHFNPVRRDAAIAGLPFPRHGPEDRVWAERVSASGLVQSEVFVDRALYRYRYSTSSSLTMHTGGAARLLAWARHRSGRHGRSVGPVSQPPVGPHVTFV